ncbi:hypothetical protein [Lignipirellula cremea]|uniref:Uncharacterized protein n=1 Tax=Lignipirellula cremea TaxID=2528010 RepID=A0A518DN94_9BACT|nr:hypothetical protein [Lignipirellula cremea]QDU93306.1 hypothetical protein Pla8534_10860 [Lignipirellula cremea]
MTLIRLCVAATVLYAATCLALPAMAEVQVSSLTPRGLQTGAVTKLGIRGQGLGPDAVLLAPFAIARQAVVGAAKANQLELEVELAPQVVPGVYSVRIASPDGVSAPVLLAVDHLPQQEWSEKVDQMPVALHGQLTGSQILETRLQGKKGMSLVVDLAGQRLGSKVQPVVRLFDTQNHELAWSPPLQRLHGDARCSVVLPADGEYRVELRDRFYRGPAPGYFRLAIGELQTADVWLPASVQRGEATQLTSGISNLPAGSQFSLTAPANDQASQRLAATPWPLIAPTPRVGVSDHPELTEQPAGASRQVLPAAPVAVSGRLAAISETDEYEIPVTAGQKLRITLFADRIGSPIDGVLMVRGEKGNQLARNDDSETESDPQLDFTAPKNVDKVVLAVQDLLRRGGEDYVYRLQVEDLSRPEFDLSLETDQITPPATGVQVLRVAANRRGYNGPIDLALTDLQGNALPGITASGQIAAGMKYGLLQVTASSEALASLVRVQGQNPADPQLTRIAVGPLASDPALAVMAGELGFAVRTAGPALSIAWVDPPEKLRLGGVLPVQIALVRPADGEVRLRLISSLEAPQKTEKVNNVDTQVDDLDQTIRLQSEKAPTDAEAVVQIAGPANATPQAYAVALVAELLSTDKKTVLQTAYSSPQTFSFERALTLKLTSKNTLNALAGEGETGELTGQITRDAGFEGPVTVALKGLIKEYPAPSVEVPADASEFTLPVRFPFGAKAQDLANISLQAIAGEPKSPEAQFSNSIDVKIKVVAGTKPK